MQEFQEQTIKVVVDENKCKTCESKACIAACKTYARGMLVLKDGVYPVVEGDPKRLGTECLACEYECWLRGNGAITIEAPVPQLEEYRQKLGIS
jgi:ferredoxin